jgi:toxin ParE1/3/4
MTLVWSKRAIRHLVALRARIAQDRPQAAAEVAARILASVDQLRQFPTIGRAGRVPGTRELVVAGTPYLIPYRVQAGQVELIAVFHGRQRWPDSL